MLYEVPLTTVPNQTLSCNINNQVLEIKLNTRLDGLLYATIKADGELVVANRICLNLGLLVNKAYSPIKSELFFFDTMARENPHFSGLGMRYRLLAVSNG